MKCVRKTEREIHMLRPSYSELMDILNTQEGIDMKVTSRYTIVIAASKRARQIIDGSQMLCEAYSGKAVTVAINEMYEGKLAISLSKDNIENGTHAFLQDGIGEAFIPEAGN